MDATDGDDDGRHSCHRFDVSDGVGDGTHDRDRDRIDVIRGRSSGSRSGIGRSFEWVSYRFTLSRGSVSPYNARK